MNTYSFGKGMGCSSVDRLGLQSSNCALKLRTRQQRVIYVCATRTLRFLVLQSNVEKILQFCMPTPK